MCPFCLDPDRMYSDNGLYFSTVLEWSLQVWLKQILGVCMMSKRNELLSSHFTLPLNWDLLLASAISNHQLIFALYSFFICPIIHHLISFSVVSLVFLSLFSFSFVFFVNLLLVPQCHLSFSCPLVSNLCCLLQHFVYPSSPTPSCVLLCYQDTRWYLFTHPSSPLQL